MGDHGDDRLHLWIAVPPDVAQQQPRTLACKVGVKDGDIKRFGPNKACWKRCCQAEEQKQKKARVEGDRRATRPRYCLRQMTCRLSAAA